MDIQLFCMRKGALPRATLSPLFETPWIWTHRKGAERIEIDNETALTRWCADVHFDIELAESYWGPYLPVNLWNARQVVHLNIANQTKAIQVARCLASYYHAFATCFDEDWVKNENWERIW